MLRGISENFQNRSNGISGLFTGTFSQNFATALRSSHRVVSLDRQDDVGCDKLATVELGRQYLRRSTFNRRHWPVCQTDRASISVYSMVIRLRRRVSRVRLRQLILVSDKSDLRVSVGT